MNKKEIADFVKSRDDALVTFVKSGRLEKVYKHCEKYGVELPKDEIIMKAGLLKAVQECTNIQEDIKSEAAMKAMKMGFCPYMFPERRN